MMTTVMQPISRLEQVKVEVKSFTQLFAESKYPIGIDNYQRPFVWKAVKIKQLIDDLQEYKQECRNQESPLDYYMGALLLHRNEKSQRFYVIDGQQRLTSLCTLYHLITDSLPPRCDFTYRNHESVVNIHSAKQCFVNAPVLHDLALLDQIVFTVIEVPSEDLAFTFFDTQNNRGVPLNATDLLKAHHLRAITDHNGTGDALQEECAKRWEALQGKEQILRQGSDFAPTLFGQFLWRARRWTGQNKLSRETHEDIIAEFQERSLSAASPDTVPLFGSHSNRLATQLTLTPGRGYSLSLQTDQAGAPSAVNLPFAIRQPIYEGIGFFLFAEKYTALIDQLLKDDHPDPEIHAFARFYREVIADLSVYLRELFLLASAIYVDQFGSRQLLHFALWSDHVLGAIRIHKAYIFRAAPLIFLRKSENNLLDIIISAYRPEDVIEWLKKAPIEDDLMPETVYRDGNVEVNKGVRGQYMQRVLTYYQRSGSLQGKTEWITASFVEEKKAVAS